MGSRSLTAFERPALAPCKISGSNRMLPVAPPAAGHGPSTSLSNVPASCHAKRTRMGPQFFSKINSSTSSWAARRSSLLTQTAVDDDEGRRRAVELPRSNGANATATAARSKRETNLSMVVNVCCCLYWVSCDGLVYFSFVMICSASRRGAPMMLMFRRHTMTAERESAKTPEEGKRGKTRMAETRISPCFVSLVWYKWQDGWTKSPGRDMRKYGSSTKV